MAKPVKKPVKKVATAARVAAPLPMPPMAMEGACCGGAGKADACGCGPDCACGAAPTCCGCVLLGLLAQGRTWLNVVVAAVGFFAFDWFWHGHLMHDMYATYEYLWRPMSEMRMDLCAMTHALTGLVFGAVFTWMHVKGVVNGAKAGLLLGLMWVPATMAAYNFQPIPLEVVQMWAAGHVLSGLLIGAVLGALRRGCCGGGCGCSA